jgi:LemA protein
MTTPLIIVGVVVLLLVVMYNSLIGKKNNVENAFGSVDVMLKKRYDLIPNLVETVKQYMTHEKETLTKITELRTQSMGGGMSSDEKVSLENQLTKALGGIMVAVENYPDLKASNNFEMLQRSWNEAEEQISAARRSYNAAVTTYNNGVEMFPTNVIAKMLNYTRKEVFEIPETERQNISAKSLFN